MSDPIRQAIELLRAFEAATQAELDDVEGDLWDRLDRFLEEHDPDRPRPEVVEHVLAPSVIPEA